MTTESALIDIALGRSRCQAAKQIRAMRADARNKSLKRSARMRKRRKARAV